MDLKNFDLSKLDFEKIFVEYIIPWGTSLVSAILIFVVGSIIAKWLVRLIGKALAKSKMDEMLVRFLTNILKWVLTLIVVIAAIEQLGVDTTSFIAILGAAGLAVGLALKDSLQNFSSGVMLLIFRPFRAGDFVKAAGVEGVVEEIRIFSTTMRSPDNQELIVPNGDIFNGTITNVTARDTRRIDLVIGVGYDDDLKLAKETLERVVRSEERVLEEPEPFIAVGELGGSSVDLHVRPWVKTPDYFATKCALTEEIKLALDDAGISIPYPQMDVHVDRTSVEAEKE